MSMQRYQFLRDLDRDLGRRPADAPAPTEIMQPDGTWVIYGIVEAYNITEDEARDLAHGHDIYAPTAHE